MAMSLKEFVTEHPVDRDRVIQGIGVGQRQVSKIENGDLENTKISTIRGYLEAVGGSLTIEYVSGEQKIRVA